MATGKTFETLNLDIDFVAVNILFIATLAYASAYNTYCIRVWLNVHELELN